MKKLLWYIRDLWLLILIMLFALIAIALVMNSIVVQWRQAIKQLSLCKHAGYVGAQYVDRHPVCYGYVEGNRLVVVPIADLKDGQ